MRRNKSDNSADIGTVWFSGQLLKVVPGDRTALFWEICREAGAARYWFSQPGRQAKSMA
jgi:hypothetical protein